MEKLKALIPDDFQQSVKSSTVDDLLSSSSSLLRLFLRLPQFHHAVSDLADPASSCCGKNMEAALDFKRRGNLSFLSARFQDALPCYSRALRLAPLDALDSHRDLVASLFLNRANVLHKLGLLTESLRDCRRALRIYPYYAKAWYRRGKLNTLFGNYEDASRDFTVSLCLESSPNGKKQLQAELKTISARQNKQTSGLVEYRVSGSASSDRLPSVPSHIELQCVSTTDKGRGMVSECGIQQATMIHVEEPYSMIISKSCRETHCHFCLNELPADTVPCPSCSITVYCTDHCQIRSGGMVSRNEMNKQKEIFENLSDDLVEYIKGITLSCNLYSETEGIQEHQHECRGANWPAILPSDVVLAGRVLVKLINQGKVAMDLSNLQETLHLSHSYSKMKPESKLELHIFAIVLLWCLCKSYCSDLSICGVSVTQAIILLSQIKVNSMAVVSMKSSGASSKSNPSGNIPAKEQIQSIEQVRVGQALYKDGSLFNHSCKPNVHAYFLSRKLVLRTTEFVSAGCPLELSYGPEVGKWDCKDRITFLEDEYFFRCQCRGCSLINKSDLVINGYGCINPNCSGVVLDSSVARCETQKLKHFSTAPDAGKKTDHPLQVSETVDADIGEVASIVPAKNGTSLHIEHGHCLRCGSHCDLEFYHAEVKRAWSHMRRLEDLTDSRGTAICALSDCLEYLNLLKSFLHKYNKGVAEAEDNVAQACYVAGDLEAARKHCEASIQILERLYEENHIVIGNELVKLASVQLSLGDSGAGDSVRRLSQIFVRYYGSDAESVFPYLRCLKEGAAKSLQ